MAGEEAKKKLCDAVENEDVATIQGVLLQNPNIVKEVSFACSRNLLHIATIHGEEAIVDKVLDTHPRLARDLDSTNSSPLHIAAANGNLEIAAKLIEIAPETLWWRDCHDMNPIHIAAMKGHVEILEELLRKDLHPAMERLHRGQTVLHLCVKHRQLGALKVLVEKMGDLVCAKDDDGETILHLAVRCNQIEIIRYLVECKKIEDETANSMGKRPHQILDESPPPTTHDYSEMKKMLNGLSKPKILLTFESLPKLTDMTMVVVVLIATMAFQATVSPPGGVWQDDTSSHSAGKAVMASTHPKIYKHFVRANNTAFVSSFITIILITTGMPSTQTFFLAMATSAMQVSIASIAVSYGASLIMTNPMETLSVGRIVAIVLSTFYGISTIIFLYMAILVMHMSWKRKKRQQQDLTNDALILRCFYHIFEWFNEMSKDAMYRFVPSLVEKVSPPSA